MTNNSPFISLLTDFKTGIWKLSYWLLTVYLGANFLSWVKFSIFGYMELIWESRVYFSDVVRWNCRASSNLVSTSSPLASTCIPRPAFLPWRSDCSCRLSPRPGTLVSGEQFWWTWKQSAQSELMWVPIPIWAAGLYWKKSLRSLVLSQKLIQLQHLVQKLMRPLASMRHLHPILLINVLKHFLSIISNVMCEKNLELHMKFAVFQSLVQ